MIAHIMKKKQSASEVNERKTIRMRKTLIQQIEELAEKDNRNFNNMVETLLMTGATQYEKRFRVS